MPMTFPMILTLLRIALIPVLVLFFYLPYTWAGFAAAAVFISAAITDWADGYLARRMGLMSKFGAFLDPVADKLMVATALVLLVQTPPQIMFPEIFFTLSAAIIIGREIAISGLREWMSEMGESGTVKVGILGKLKTIFQMTAISCLLFQADLFGPGWLRAAWAYHLRPLSGYLPHRVMEEDPSSATRRTGALRSARATGATGTCTRMLRLATHLHRRDR